MNKMMSSALTGAAVTMAVGTAAYMLTGKGSTSRKRRQMKKSAVKAAQAVGDIVGGITAAMR